MRCTALLFLTILLIAFFQSGNLESPSHLTTPLSPFSSEPLGQSETRDNAGGCSPCSLTLITGDQFFVWADRTGRILNLARGEMWQSETRGYLVGHLAGDTYVIPSSADLNRLDLRFFDVSYLIQNGFQKLSYLPVIAQTTNEGFRPISIPLRTTPTVGAEELESTSTHSSHAVETYGSVLNDFSISKVFLDGVVRSAIVPDADLLQRVESSVYGAEGYPYNGTGNGLIGANSAWAQGYTGKNVKVALLDTGIWKQHPDFFFPNGASKIIYEADYTDDQNVTDLFGHGTWTASILAGTGDTSQGLFSGTAPGAQLLNIKVLNHAGFGYDSWVIAGIQDAISQKVDIISMSLGGSPDQVIDEAVQNATDQGIIVVSAAGNSGPNYFSVGSPAEAPNGLAVGASSIPEWFGSPPRESQVWFSSNGPSYAFNFDGASAFASPTFAVKPDLLAPGWQIVGVRAPYTVLGGLLNNIPSFNGNYFALSGTSASAPHASGAIAILKQAFPSWSSKRIIDDLISTSTLLNQGWFDSDKLQLGCCGVEQANSSYALDVYQQGGGRINLTAALTPSLIITPSDLRLVVGKSVSLQIYNPSAYFINFDLKAAIKNLENGADASSLVKLSVPSTGLAPRATLTVRVTLNSRGVATAFYGGYIWATAASNPLRILAHSNLGFYKLNYMTIQANDPTSQPMSGGLALVAMQNLTWFGFSFYTPFLAPLGANGRTIVPVLDGVNTVLAATVSCGRIICGAYAAGTQDIEETNSTLLLESRSDYPVTFQPYPSNSSIRTMFSDFRLTNLTLATPYGEISWDFGIGIGLAAPDLHNVPIYVPATGSANSLRVAYEYLPFEPSHLSTIYYPAYEFHNVNSPLKIEANDGSMVVKESLYRSAPLVLTDTQWIASSPILGAEGGFGDSFHTGLPSNVTLHLSANWQYVDTQWYPSQIFLDANLLELFYTGAPGTKIFDDFGRRPYFPASSIDSEISALGTTGIRFQLGPLLTSFSKPADHLVSSLGSGYLYMNDTLRQVVRDSNSPFEGVITSIQGRTKVTLEWIAAAGLWFTNYAALNLTFWADGSSSKQGTTWVPPPSIINLEASNLDANNTATSSQTVVQVTASTPAISHEPTLELEYSTDHGIRWTPAQQPIISGSYLQGGESLTDYQVTLPATHYLPVSLRIHLSNSQGGQTTMTLLNAFASKDYLNSMVNIFTPQDGTLALTKEILIRGQVISAFLYPAVPPPLRINDTRFTIASWNETDGTFTFTNATRISPGAATLKITFTDIYGRSSSSTVKLNFKANSLPNDAPFSLLLEAIPATALSFIALRYLIRRSVRVSRRSISNP